MLNPGFCFKNNEKIVKNKKALIVRAFNIIM